MESWVRRGNSSRVSEVDEMLSYPGSPLSLQVGLHVLRLHVPGLYLLFSVTGRGDLQRAQEAPPEGR
ncbi:hypothetical protein [Metallosphaera yellowstonensis]|uniref:hypothetical protein n=1 Tax=Metallosphaera yellowstonensis TaxID=1111107 RepID=UPI001C0F4B80|nr:hypothetical protein [Metallosphaera yellowstonensis]